MSEFEAPGGHGAAGGQGYGEEREHGDLEGRRRRYLRVFKRLEPGRTATVEHGMGTFPLVDVYQLASFPVISSADDATERTRVQFYLYHTSDRRARVRNPDGTRGDEAVVDDPPATRISFESALRAYGVPCDDDRHLGDAVVEFWKALFAPPSDPFDETGYASSPWLDRNIGDRRSVGELKRGGEWDDLWLLLRPRKTINWPPAANAVTGDPVLRRALESFILGNRQQALDLLRTPSEAPPVRGGSPAPPGVVVTHLGPRTVGLELQTAGPELQTAGLELRKDGPADEVPVMVLLRS